MAYGVSNKEVAQSTADAPNVRQDRNGGCRMAKASRTHHSDEFGRPGSSAVSGLNAPTIGAPAMITLAGITERESGVTPPPPPVSVKAMIIGLVIMLVLGLALLVTMIGTQPSNAPRTLDEISGFRGAPQQ
jgi:hypothetical protein